MVHLTPRFLHVPINFRQRSHFRGTIWKLMSKYTETVERLKTVQFPRLATRGCHVKNSILHTWAQRTKCYWHKRYGGPTTKFDCRHCDRQNKVQNVDTLDVSNQRSPFALEKEVLVWIKQKWTKVVGIGFPSRQDHLDSSGQTKLPLIPECERSLTTTQTLIKNN